MNLQIQTADGLLLISAGKSFALCAGFYRPAQLRFYRMAQFDSRTKGFGIRIAWFRATVCWL